MGGTSEEGGAKELCETSGGSEAKEWGGTSEGGEAWELDRIGEGGVDVGLSSNLLVKILGSTTNLKMRTDN